MADYAINCGISTATSTGLTVPNAAGFQGLTAFTIECFIYVPQLPTANNGKIINFYTGNLGYQFSFDGSGHLTCQAGNSSTNVSAAFLTALSIKTKYHVACCWDGSNITGYFAGVKDGNTTALSGGNTGNPNQVIWIGNQIGGTRAFPGTIDDLRISNIARYSNTFTPPPGPLIADSNTIELWHFNEGFGMTATGVNGNVGTLSGSPLPSWVAGLIVPQAPVYVQGNAPQPIIKNDILMY